MTPRREFIDLLDEAVSAMCANGFDPDLALHFSAQLRGAARRVFKPTSALAEQGRRVLASIYERSVPKRGKPPKAHQGISIIAMQRMQPQLSALRDRRASEMVRLIEKNRAQTLDEIANAFNGWASSVPPQGMRVSLASEAKADIKKVLRSLDWKERRVIIDQGHKLRSNIDDLIALEGGAIAQMWHSHWRSPNYRYRPDHKARDQRIYLIRDCWALKQGLIKPDPRLERGEQYTDQITRPGEEVFCFPESTRIPFADSIEKAFRRRYRGELTTIVTGSGKTLSGTPNHPVLTPQGWRAIGSLQEGDYVVEVADDRGHPGRLSECDENDAQPTIAEIFRALAKSGVSEMRAGKPNHFHGDGTDENVHIVNAKGSLLIYWKSSRSRRVCNLVLTRPDHLATGRRSLDLFSMARALVATRFLSRLCASAMLLGRLVRGDKDIRRAAPAWLAAGLTDALSDRRAIDPKALGEGEDALTSLVGGADRRAIADRLPFPAAQVAIHHVSASPFDGWVYNLQTVNGYYVANGIVAHNCRCWCTSLYSLRDLPEDMLTAKGREYLAHARAA